MTARHRYLQPSHWWSYPRRLRARREYHRLHLEAARALASLGPVGDPAADRVVLIDGMYDSPNHYFRLRLFLDAVSRNEVIRPVGVIRNSRERSQCHSLEALGVRDFLILDESGLSTETFRPQARRLMSGVRSHSDLLALDLPHGLPAHIFYDTALKEVSDPQPPLSSDVWERYLAESLRDLAVYERFFDRNDVAHMPYSHPWKNEYATGFWLALSRGVPTYHLTAYLDTLRIVRFRDLADYPDKMEKLEYAAFRALPPGLRNDVKALGRGYLAERIQGNTTDINGSRAFDPDCRELDRARARQSLGADDDRPVGLICAHAWYDFPHNQEMTNFTDFIDWITVTIDTIREVEDVIWFLKPHPLESWYGGFRMADAAGDLPEHIRLLPEKSDSATSLAGADVVVTVFGTIGIEATAGGLPVITADRSYYSDWRFTHEAENRADYVRLLREAATLARPSRDKQDEAAAFAYFALAPHPEDAGLVRIICDSLGPEVPRFVTRQITEGNGDDYDREVETVANWLTAGSRSYSVDVKMERIVALDAAERARA